eukprot:6422674-Prymnesium_polylepis.1
MAVPVRGRGAWSHSMVRAQRGTQARSRRRRVGPWSFHGTWVTRDIFWIQSFNNRFNPLTNMQKTSVKSQVSDTLEKTEKRDDAMWPSGRNPRR